MQRFTFFIAFFLLINSAFSQQLSVIPQPYQVQFMSQRMQISSEIKFVVDPNNADLVWLADYSKKLFLPDLLKYKSSKAKAMPVKLELLKSELPFLGSEGYELKINESGIQIAANNKAGLFYGIQTLYQLINADTLGSISFLRITDQPRFKWRGMHLDVSRHFYPKEFILKYIDYLAMYKMNTFHWHLTDDQGWRIEIKKYPLLTSIGGYRVNRENLAWNSRPFIKEGEKADYGGFYTQADIKEVVAYAAKRNITIVPEIEMPAHAMAVLAAYPQLSCSGKNLGVPPGGVWPITHIFCAGNDSVFTFMQDVLTEVMALFPSKYIHIGGDEATKTEWEHCPKCQARMKAESLKNVEELQSYFVKRIEKFVVKNNRKIIGWDEILEGGLAPEAAVMSWRGESGGIAASKEKHFVVMSPGTHCYFDHYQGTPSAEPLAIGGFTPLKKVYSFEPIPTALNAEEANYIMGAQANVWTEFMPTSKNVEYMIFPRIAALSEVLWSSKESRNWESFSSRMAFQYKRYEQMGVNYSKSAYQPRISTRVDSVANALELSIASDIHNADIRYSIGNYETNLQSEKYIQPIMLKETAVVHASVMENGIKMSDDLIFNFEKHLAFGCEVQLKNDYSKQYSAGGKYGLCDGLVGTTSLSDGRWQGFNGRDMVAVIDLKSIQYIHKIYLNALQSNSSWVFMPKEVIFEISDDGITFTEIARVENKVLISEVTPTIEPFICKLNNVKTRFVRVTARSIGNCPAGHTGEGKPSWLFVDEIFVQ